MSNKFKKKDLQDSLRFKSIVKQGVPEKFRPHFYSISTSTCYVFLEKAPFPENQFLLFLNEDTSKYDS